MPKLVGSNDELALKGAELQVFTVKEAMETDGDDSRKTVRRGRLAGTAIVKMVGAINFFLPCTTIL